jgi:integrase
MAWLEKRKKYRIRDWVDGKKVTVVPDVGIWKEIAQKRLTEYREKHANGGKPFSARSLTMPRACDVFFAKHSPSLKPSTAYDMKCRLDVIKRLWETKILDGITEYDVRDLLLRFKTTGTRLKYLRTLTTLFKLFIRNNKKEGKILDYMVNAPAENPASEWRREMEPHEKKELPKKRVLSPQEWHTFRPALTRRAGAICEIALGRFLRRGDIKQICRQNIRGDMIEGVQTKTGEPYIVPVLEKQPIKYDFTNFRKEFQQAQIKAGMNHQRDCPLHFTMRDLRRTGATWYYNETKDLVGVSKMLGHTNLQTTRRYLNIDETDLRAIARVMDGKVFKNSGGRGGAPVGQNLATDRK